MTVTKDVCRTVCSLGYEQLVQTCVCVCVCVPPWTRTALVAVSLVARGGVVLQKPRDLRLAPLTYAFVIVRG